MEKEFRITGGQVVRNRFPIYLGTGSLQNVTIVLFHAQPGPLSRQCASPRTSGGRRTYAALQKLNVKTNAVDCFDRDQLRIASLSVPKADRQLNYRLRMKTFSVSTDLSSNRRHRLDTMAAAAQQAASGRSSRPQPCASSAEQARRDPTTISFIVARVAPTNSLRAARSSNASKSTSVKTTHGADCPLNR